MMNEWLTEKCITTDPCEIRRLDLDSLGLSEADKQALFNRREHFERWIETKWDPFIAEMIAGDELWRFRSPDHTWASLAGRAGYAIVRDGEIVRSLVTMLS
jgi:hypothetical protein